VEVERPGNGTEWRLRTLENHQRRMEELKLDAQIEKIDQLQEDMRRLRTALLTFGFSILAAAVIFALAVFRILGGN
jgi:uncharacterized membrane protein (DUF106 family)